PPWAGGGGPGPRRRAPVPAQPSCPPAPKPGAPGAPTQPCTCGPPKDRVTSSRSRPMTATQPETFTLDRIPAPIGALLVAVDAEGRLSAVDFFNEESGMRRMLRRQYGEVAVRFGEAPASIPQAFATYFRPAI